MCSDEIPDVCKVERPKARKAHARCERVKPETFYSEAAVRRAEARPGVPS